MEIFNEFAVNKVKRGYEIEMVLENILIRIAAMLSVN